MKNNSFKNRKVIIPRLLFLIIAFLIVGIVVWISMRIYQYNQHQILLSQHPLKYSEYVERYANENNLDPFLVYAVIKTESSFVPTSVSNVGATGLMQIMSDTFDWIQYRLDDNETVYEDMNDPETNIRYGCYLLGYLFKLYGNMDCAIAAYHAGPGSVSSWLKNPEYSDDGITLKDIPIADTKHYLRKIHRAYEIYKQLYENGGT